MLGVRGIVRSGYKWRIMHLSGVAKRISCDFRGPCGGPGKTLVGDSRLAVVTTLRNPLCMRTLYLFAMYEAMGTVDAYVDRDSSCGIEMEVEER